MKERHPEWKALVQIPGVGCMIDIISSKNIVNVSFEDYMVMSLEAAFLYMKEYARGFVISHNRNHSDTLIPDDVRDYILDNMTEDPTLPA